MWYIYILHCSDKSLYVGVTNNVKKRVAKHALKKGSKYVASRLPFKLVYTEKYQTKPQALKREAELKSRSHREKEDLVLNKRE